MIDKTKLNDTVICKEDDSILEVSRILRDTRSRHLIVVNKDLKPIGVISTVDINNRVVAEKKDIENTKAISIMTKPLSTIDINETYDEAYKRMIDKGTYSIPVTDNGKLIGTLDFNQIFARKPEVKKWKA